MDKVYTLYEEYIENYNVLDTVHTEGIIYSIKSLKYNRIYCFSLFDKFVTIENIKKIKLQLKVNNASKQIITLFNRYVKETFKR